jgi:hypothetical protein
MQDHLPAYCNGTLKGRSSLLTAVRAAEQGRRILVVAFPGISGRGLALVAESGGIGAGIEQQGNEFIRTRGGRLVQRSEAPRLSEVHIGPLRDQKTRRFEFLA